MVGAKADPHAAWLEAIARGEEAAMRGFYDTYAPVVYAFALRRLEQPAEAADLVHEVMLEVWQKADTYGGRSRVRTWLLGIAHHKILDRLRVVSRHRERETGTEPDSLPAEPEGVLEALAAAASARWVRYCLERLSVIHRQVMHLAFFQELSYPEIAAILDCPTGTVKTRMLHARRQMKRCLAAVGAAGDPDTA